MNQKGLDKAFSSSSGSYSSTENTDSKSNEPEFVRIVNFAEEIKNKELYTGMDICFVLDATGSMGAYIKGAIQCIKSVMADANKSLEKLNASANSLKFSIVAYRDHPPQENTWVTQARDFTDTKTAEEFLNTITASGGGDAPEAVLDGLNEALNGVNWRKESEKFMFLLLDNPPHGKQYGSYGDGFPDGCPCGFSEVKLLPQLRDMKIELTIVKIGKAIDEMIKIFSQYTNIDVFQPSIFNGSRYGGDYEVKVKEVMRDNFSYKINANLEAYTTSQKEEEKNV